MFPIQTSSSPGYVGSIRDAMDYNVVSVVGFTVPPELITQRELVDSFEKSAVVKYEIGEGIHRRLTDSGMPMTVTGIWKEKSRYFTVFLIMPMTVTGIWKEKSRYYNFTVFLIMPMS
jgi:hypothetical protein